MKRLASKGIGGHTSNIGNRGDGDIQDGPISWGPCATGAGTCAILSLYVIGVVLAFAKSRNI